MRDKEQSQILQDDHYDKHWEQQYRVALDRDKVMVWRATDNSN